MEAAGPDWHAELCAALDVTVEPALLERALTHRSYAYENGNLPTNERLEFLGDSVLGLVVTDTLYRSHPELPEGQLAKLRAAVVNMRALADVGRELRLGDYVRLGRGEETTGGRDKTSILADTLEAVLGAVYIGTGLPEAAALVHRLFDPLIEQAATLGAGLDWKTSLQELTASASMGVPEYVVTRDRPGPPEAVHRRRPGGRRGLRPGPGTQQEGGRAGGRGHRLAPAARRAAPRRRPDGAAPTEGTDRSGGSDRPTDA